MSKGAKIWLIIAFSLVLLGCIIFGSVMTMFKWDFTKLSTVKYETNNYDINENYKDISIETDTADIVFMPTEGLKTSVACREQKNMKHSVAVKDDTLVIEVVDTRKWYEYIGINFGATEITVYIPQGEYGRLSVNGSTGNISVEHISADVLDLSVSTGRITVSDANCRGDVKINVSTGKTNLTDVKCKNLTSSGSTGDISLKNVIAAETFSIERSTGDIKLDGCDAAEIFIETNTGDVRGTLLSEKVFITDTDTGSIKVPNSVTGGRCEITTDTGNIKIDVIAN